MSSPEQATPLVVIGAGPGGYAAAFRAADLGLAVTLVDPEPNPGGVCLYRGCIPSKALLHVARLIGEARHAARWGVRFGPPEIDLDGLRSWKDAVVAKLTRGLGQLRQQRRVDYVQGRARFAGAGRLDVETVSGERRRLRFEHAIVATGSSAARPAGFPADSPRVLDSTDALALADVPPSLLVVGGGYIGLEMGSVYAALGSRVTVVEMLDGLLPGVDRDLVRPLHEKLARELAEIHLSTRVAALDARADTVRVRLESGASGSSEREFDRVLVAVGRRPNTAQLGLELTAVERGPDGFLRVDAQRRTADPSIFAIGDVTGQPMLAHKASHEGRVAAETIAGHRVAFEPKAIPAVVFTDPEVAWCGLTEAEALERGRSVQVTRFPWAASGRATTLDRGEGLTKLVVDPDTKRLLGVGIVGPGAGELIGEGTLAVEMAALATDLQLTIHAHPTLSETLMEAAESVFGASTHLGKSARG